MKEKRPISGHLTDVKIQVARVEERLVGMGKEQESIGKNVITILGKLDSHQKSIDRYKNDRNWVVGIFSVLYGGLLAWLGLGHK